MRARLHSKTGYRFALAVRESLKTLQFDVNTAYLNSDLKETVYMRIPDGIKCEDENLVLRLNKAIYGHKVVHHTYIAIYIAIRNEFFVVFSFIFDTTRSSLFERWVS